MTKRAEVATAKTREQHERDMAAIASATRNLFISWQLIDDEDSRGSWVIDRDGLAALQGRALIGKRARYFMAASEVWSTFIATMGIREGVIDRLVTADRALQALTAALECPETRAYLLSASMVGHALGLQHEQSPESSVGLDERSELLLKGLPETMYRVKGMAEALADRRQTGMARNYYGPKRAGPMLHLAVLLHRAGFSYRQIAILRGDVCPFPRKLPLGNQSTSLKEYRREWKDKVKDAGEEIRHQIYHATS